MQETWVWFLDWEDPLETEVANHSCILAGEFHGQKSLVGSSPWGCRVRHDWMTNTFTSFRGNEGHVPLGELSLHSSIRRSRLETERWWCGRSQLVADWAGSWWGARWKEVVLGFRLGEEAFGNPRLGRVQGFQLNQQTRLGGRRWRAAGRQRGPFGVRIPMVGKSGGWVHPQGSWDLWGIGTESSFRLWGSCSTDLTQHLLWSQKNRCFPIPG